MFALFFIAFILYLLFTWKIQARAFKRAFYKGTIWEDSHK